MTDTIKQRLADAGLRVKPLEWCEDFEGAWYGTSSLPNIGFWVFHKGDSYEPELPKGRHFSGTLDEVKAVQQTRYEAIVLAALEVME